MRLLLIEDSPRLQRTLSRGLRKAGYALDVTGDGREGLWYAESNNYDSIILDLMLPGLDGWSILARLRDRAPRGRPSARQPSQQHAPILVLTARDTLQDRVRGLQMGGDDYLVKPFSFDELLARLQALVRRAHGVPQPRMAVGDFEIDFIARQVSRDNLPIDLSPRDFALLEYMVMSRGRVVTRAEIESHIYDDQTELMSNVVDTGIYALRKRLDRPGQRSVIQTHRGMGYSLELSAG